MIRIYLNADEMEQSFRQQRYLNFTDYEITTSAEEVLPFFQNSPFLNAAGFGEAAKALTFTDGRLEFGQVEMNSYFASVAGDFIRQKLLAEKKSFTMETVMSHPSKVELLAAARDTGYHNYLYFVATEDPNINISRVRNRVRLGGHTVPEDRITTRYHRSLGLLLDAIRHTHRAYIFDNSSFDAGGKHVWLAEVTDGRDLELKTDRIPAWFKRAVLDNFTLESS